MAKKGAIKFILTARVDSCELILFEPFLFLEITVTYIGGHSTTKWTEFCQFLTKTDILFM